MKLRVAILALCVSATAANAESKAWTTAKSKLPAGMTAVVGINIAPIKASALYQQLLPLAMAKSGKAKDGLDKIKATCGIDYSGALDSVVVGMQDDDHVVAIIQLKGTTQKDLEACGQKVAKADGKKLTVTRDGAITKYSGMGDDDAYVRWLSKSSLAIAADKDTLTTLTAGGIAKDTLGSEVSKLNTSSAFWVAVNKSTDIDELHGKTTGGYGTLDLKGGNLVVNAHIIMDSPKTAAAGVTQGETQLDQVKKSGQVPKQFAPLLDSIKLSSSGADLVAAATVAETDLASLIQMAAQLAH